jgi:hypothetical protein
VKFPSRISDNDWQEYPEARVFASTFDAFIDDLRSADAKGKVELESITAEMGDTWIYGYASDYRKMAEFRAFSNMRDKCLRESWCNLRDPRVFNASRFLLKLAEHTWGLYGVVGDGQPPYWSNDAFRAHVNDSGFRVAAQSWVEQAAYVQWALDALGTHPLAQVVQQELQDLVPVRPNVTALQRIPESDFGQLFACGKTIQVGVNANTGEINRLVMFGGQTVATPQNPIAALSYNTYDERDFDWYADEYSYSGSEESAAFVKPHLDSAMPSPVSKTWRPMLQELYFAPNSVPYVGCRLVQKLTFGQLPTSEYGAPQETWVSLSFI